MQNSTSNIILYIYHLHCICFYGHITSLIFNLTARGIGKSVHWTLSCLMESVLNQHFLDSDFKLCIYYKCTTKLFHIFHNQVCFC